MPITANQLALGANYQLEAYASGDPVDQINTERPLMKWLVAGKMETIGGNEYFNEKVRFTNDSNYQNYYGDDQVSYNRKDTVRLAKFSWANFHDGFGLNEDELAANGITLTDDTEAVVTDAEKIQIINLMKENYATLKEGVQESFDVEAHLSGSQDADAVQGLDHLISTTPATGTVGGINAANATWWRNNVNLAIAATAGVLTTKMEQTWRACQTYGKMTPDKIICGSTFLDAYRSEFKATIVRQAETSGRALPSGDTSITDLYFKGVKIEWDPTMDRLDAIVGVIDYPWIKRCYFLNSKTLKLRPLRGHWMVNRKPKRVYDRYVHYFGMTSKYRMTINKRNANAVLSVA